MSSQERRATARAVAVQCIAERLIGLHCTPDRINTPEKREREAAHIVAAVLVLYKSKLEDGDVPYLEALRAGSDPFEKWPPVVRGLITEAERYGRTR